MKVNSTHFDRQFCRDSRCKDCSSSARELGVLGSEVFLIHLK